MISNIPVENKCPKCGANPGKKCKIDPEELKHKKFHQISYSFHSERYGYSQTEAQPLTITAHQEE